MCFVLPKESVSSFRSTEGIVETAKVQQSLTPVVARLQAERHHTALHRRGVEVAGDVLDLVAHRTALGVNAWESPQWGSRNR